MKTFIKKEAPLLLVIVLPMIYLFSLWDQLPERVPVHYNISGKADRYGDKSELILIALLLPVLPYLITKIAPLIDPKKRLQYMGDKYGKLRTLITVAMSALAIFIIYNARDEQQFRMNFLVFGLGALYVILGNYFKTIRPNYFIGIKTPWTLENETVWKDTHRMAGKYWFAGGVLIMICSLFLDQEVLMTIFLAVTIMIALIPIVYSYRRFEQLKN